MFNPTCGNTPILTDTFQMGWNHQLDEDVSVGIYHIITTNDKILLNEKMQIFDEPPKKHTQNLP